MVLPLVSCESPFESLYTLDLPATPATGPAHNVEQEGETTQLSLFDIDARRGVGGQWWRWCDWPYYWQRLNGATELSWNVDLDPGESITLDAEWHYFWR